MVFTGHIRHAGKPEELIKRRLAQLRCDIHGGNITAEVQGIGCGHRTEKTPVEIFRRISTKCRGHVFENSHRMQHALLHSQCVNKRFERRARRTFRVGAVYLSLNIAVEVIGRSHQRSHPHVTGIDQQNGGVVNTATFVTGDKRIDLPLNQPLQAGVNRGVRPGICTGKLLILLTQLFDKMRCNIGHLLRLTQRQRQSEQRDLAAVSFIMCLPALEKPVTRLRQRRAQDTGLRVNTITR